MGRGYQGAPKGGALAAAGLPLGIKDPVVGDLLAFDAASGTWVNSANLRIGMMLLGAGLTIPGADQGLSPDLSTFQVEWQNGMTVAEGADHITVPVAGRYQAIVAVTFQRHATQEIEVGLSVGGSGPTYNSDYTGAGIAMPAAVDSENFGNRMQITSVWEGNLAAGEGIVIGLNGAPATGVADIAVNGLDIRARWIGPVIVSP